MFIGIDIGGTGIKGLMTDASGKIYASGKTPTPKTAKEIDSAIAQLACDLAEKGKISFSRIKAIGIGSAGTINSRKGIIITSPNIPSLNNYPLAAKIEKLTGKKTFLENDANIAVLGELWLGRGAKYRNWIMLTLGTGIGGGAIIEGKLMNGRNGVAGEFGHITLDHNGEQCPCGSKGCFERYASAAGLIRTAQSLTAKYPKSSICERMKTEKLDAKMISEECAKKDPLAVEAVETVAYYLGVGIATLANVFNPEAVILAGGLSRDLGQLLPGIQKQIDARAIKGAKENIKILAVKHEDKGPALGAIKNAMDRLSELKKR
ncbi:MAG: ROK family protein [Spirochaetota bacterium]